MDQCVVDLEDDEAAAGDEVVLFGAGDRGRADRGRLGGCGGTINYEIVTRLGARIPRRYVGGRAGGAS